MIISENIARIYNSDIVKAIIYLMHLLYANLYIIPFVYILFNAL